MTASGLQEEILAAIARGVDAPLPDAELERLASAVFAYQFERNAPYRAFCRARGKAPESVGHWSEIPAIPTHAFRYADLTTVPPEQIRVTYRTSGTTHGTERRGRNLLPGTELYDASLLENFRAHLLPDRSSIRVLIYGPSSEYFPNSSLGHMNSRVIEKLGAPGSGIYWREDGPRRNELLQALSVAEKEGEPVCLLGTAFGFVHLLDYLGEERRAFRLPSGSRLMDTGGYKGRSREAPKAELYSLYEQVLGIAMDHIVNEYGMTELSSQFYDNVLRLSGCQSPSEVEPVNSLHPSQRRKLPPPWVRTQVVDPESLQPLPAGEIGLLRHYDLANLHTVFAIQTDDLGVQRGEGFEVLGRAAGAEPRGCSLAVEEFLAARGRDH